jgi:hypothetical protein
MKTRSCRVGLLAAALLATTIVAQEPHRGGTATGDYLGQPPPGATPEVFARDLVSLADTKSRTERWLWTQG